MNASWRAWKTVVVLAAALLFAVALFRSRSDAPGTTPSRALPTTTATGDEPPSSPVRRSPLPASPRAPDGRSPGAAPTPASAERRPTPGVVDLGKLWRAPAKPPSDDERFPTNAWFTKEDLHHPERYFERAEQMPDLKRPEERRDTLAFFLAYREQLERDLAAAGDDRTRDETRAAIQRYDAAIAQLRALVSREDPAL